jgi:hypothetical protein
LARHSLKEADGVGKQDGKQTGKRLQNRLLRHQQKSGIPEKSISADMTRGFCLAPGRSHYADIEFILSKGAGAAPFLHIQRMVASTLFRIK